MRPIRTLSDSSSSESFSFTFEQFQWAMEAVHSRAFKGNFSGSDPLKELSKTLIPFAAAAFGLSYIRSSSSPYLFTNDDNITFLLLLVACSPVILNFINDNIINGNGTKSVDVVMLPFIDSANHKESVRSNIEFDPLKGAFTVTMEGSNCIERDEGKNEKRGKSLKQFYISYGEKRDTELLLKVYLQQAKAEIPLSLMRNSSLARSDINLDLLGLNDSSFDMSSYRAGGLALLGILKLQADLK